MKTNEQKLSTALIVACGLLGIAVLIIWMMVRNNKMEEELEKAANIAHMDAIAHHANMAKSYADSAHDLAVGLAIYRDSTKSVIRAKDSKINRLMGIIGQQAPPTAHEDTVCERFIVTGLRKDTVISELKAKNEVYEAENVVQDSTFASFRRFKDQEIAQKDSASTTLQLQADNLSVMLLKAEKKAKRKENWNRVWKVTSLVAAGVAAVFILK